MEIEPGQGQTLEEGSPLAGEITPEFMGKEASIQKAMDDHGVSDNDDVTAEEKPEDKEETPSEEPEGAAEVDEDSPEAITKWLGENKEHAKSYKNIQSAFTKSQQKLSHWQGLQIQL